MMGLVIKGTIGEKFKQNSMVLNASDGRDIRTI
jgi:hypothetical protein